MKNKKEYIEYINSLKQNDLEVEFKRMSSLLDDLKFNYEYFKGYIYVNILDIVKKKISNNKIDFKELLKWTVDELNNFNNNYIKPYLNRIDDVKNEYEEEIFEPVTLNNLINLYEDIYLNENSGSNGEYLKIHKLSLLCENNTCIYNHYIFKNKYLPKEFEGWLDCMFGKKDPNNQWDYKDVLKMLLIKITSWFDVINFI